MKKTLRVLGLILALMTAVFMTASAQTEGLFPESISVDVEELTLQAGEGYTYTVTILPEESGCKDYTVYVSDPFAVEVDIENSLIAALAPGTAYLYFDTANHSAHAIVKVTVGEGAELGAKAVWGISEEDLAKVHSESLKSFLTFINESMSANSVDRAPTATVCSRRSRTAPRKPRRPTPANAASPTFPSSTSVIRSSSTARPTR